MSDPPLWAKTDDQIEVVHRARERGGICAWCGRAFADGETVYIEWVRVGAARDYPGGPIKHRSIVLAPVGVECAAPDLLEWTHEHEPDPCGHCGRGVFYRTVHPLRIQAMCSRRCERDLRWARKREGRRVEDRAIDEQPKTAGPLVPAPTTDGVGARIRHYREARGMSRADLALAVRLRGRFARTDHVRRWEEDGIAPRVESFGALALALGVSIETLLYGGAEAAKIAAERESIGP